MCDTDELRKEDRAGGKKISRRTARRVSQAKAVGRGRHVEEDRVLADAGAHLRAGIAQVLAALSVDFEKGQLDEDEEIKGKRPRTLKAVENVEASV